MSLQNSPQKQDPKKLFIHFFLLLFFKVFITCIYSQFNVSVYSDSVLYYAMSITRDDDHFVLCVPQKVLDDGLFDLASQWSTRFQCKNVFYKC